MSIFYFETFLGEGEQESVAQSCFTVAQWIAQVKRIWGGQSWRGQQLHGAPGRGEAEVDGGAPRQGQEQHGAGAAHQQRQADAGAVGGGNTKVDRPYVQPASRPRDGQENL